MQILGYKKSVQTQIYKTETKISMFLSTWEELNFIWINEMNKCLRFLSIQHSFTNWKQEFNTIEFYQY